MRSLALAIVLSLFPHPAQRDTANTLLNHARLVTTFSKAETEEWAGYQWVSATDIVFQRKGGYIRRSVQTGAEQKVLGDPEQDKAHWFGGNLMARFTPDGKWILYHGRRGNEEWDDGSLRVDSFDGEKQLSWPAGKFPEVAAMSAYWLADNETWVCPATWRTAGSACVSGVVTGSVRSPGKVRRIPWGRDADENWDIIATGRDRLYAVVSPEERKPPAVRRVRVTELILGKRVTQGRSWLIRFRKPVHAFCNGGMSSKGVFLWSLVVKGNPWYGRRPLVTAVAVWRPGQPMRELGRLVTTEEDDEWRDEPGELCWLPDGTHFSFEFQHGVYVASAE